MSATTRRRTRYNWRGDSPPRRSANAEYQAAFRQRATWFLSQVSIDIPEADTIAALRALGRLTKKQETDPRALKAALERIIRDELNLPLKTVRTLRTRRE